MFPKLEKALKDRQITKSQLAKKIGISGSSLSNKFSGKSQFRFWEVAIIAKLLTEFKIDELFTRESQPCH